MALETYEGTSPKLPREFVGEASVSLRDISGFVVGESDSKVVGACFFVEPLDFTSL